MTGKFIGNLTRSSAMECFLKGMYDSNVLRKNITVDTNELYLTGTLGCALFPDDADKFDDLFNTVDIDSISKINPDFGRILKERNLSSVIIMKIRKNEKAFAKAEKT